MARVWALKARQKGISTLGMGAIFSLTSQTPNVTSLIMADEESRSLNIASMVHLFYDCLWETHPHLLPKCIKSNTEIMEFGNKSRIIIATAGNLKVGRSFTPQYVHLSEVAYFPDFNAIATSLFPGIPDYWDTVVIGETTANGMDMFYDEWMRAIQGKSDWIAHFMPWHTSLEYSMPLINGELYPLEGVKLEGSSSTLEFEEEENKLRVDYKLSEGQINWRRWKICNQFQGDIRKFKQEYPICWEESFVMSGDNYFNIRGMSKQEGKEPEDVGDLFYNGTSMKYDFRPDKYGKVEVFRYPDKKAEYVVAGDASEGGGGDEAAALVLNKKTGRTDAVVYGSIVPEELAKILIALGTWYNNGMIAPESKGFGYTVCQMVNEKYGNIYRAHRLKNGVLMETEELGFNTNLSTRPAMLSMMNDEIKEEYTQLVSRQLISECQTFIIKYDKQNKVRKIEAAGGKQDGLVICRAIAGYVRSLYPFNPQKEVTKGNRLMYSKKKRRYGMASREG